MRESEMREMDCFRLRSDHDQAIGNLAENMNRLWLGFWYDQGETTQITMLRERKKTIWTTIVYHDCRTLHCLHVCYVAYIMKFTYDYSRSTLCTSMCHSECQSIPCVSCGTGGMIRFETCPKNFTTFRRWDQSCFVLTRLKKTPELKSRES